MKNLMHPLYLKPYSLILMSTSGLYPDKRIKFRAKVSILTGSPMSKTNISPVNVKTKIKNYAVLDFLY